MQTIQDAIEELPSCGLNGAGGTNACGCDSWDDLLNGRDVRPVRREVKP